MKHTVNCVRCGKPAKKWCGYVRAVNAKGRRVNIIAGWCTDRCLLNDPGFSGHWLRSMGATDNPFAAGRFVLSASGQKGGA